MTLVTTDRFRDLQVNPYPTRMDRLACLEDPDRRDSFLQQYPMPLSPVETNNIPFLTSFLDLLEQPQISLSQRANVSPRFESIRKIDQLGRQAITDYKAEFITAKASDRRCIEGLKEVKGAFQWVKLIWRWATDYHGKVVLVQGSVARRHALVKMGVLEEQRLNTTARLILERVQVLLKRKNELATQGLFDQDTNEEISALQTIFPVACNRTNFEETYARYIAR